MKKEVNLYENGLEEYPWLVVLAENLALAGWILIGAVIAWQFSLLIALSYLGFALTMILVVMRKLVCTRCYYYGKRCHLGWGLISKALFRQGEIVEFESCPGIRFAPIFFGLLAIIPLILGVILLIQSFSFFTAGLQALLLISIIYSSVISRKKSCAPCKMKLICPGSAVKEE